MSVTLEELDQTVQKLHDAVSRLARQLTECGKLQYTPYGKCLECKYHDVCRTLEEV
jgi:hypothetical protein